MIYILAKIVDVKMLERASMEIPSRRRATRYDFLYGHKSEVLDAIDTEKTSFSYI
jgi:hypothetical protein